jgi:hypothetical protein
MNVSISRTRFILQIVEENLIFPLAPKSRLTVDISEYHAQPSSSIPQYTVFLKHSLDKTLGRMAFFPCTTNRAFSPGISRQDVLERLDNPDYDLVLVELMDLATANQDADLL